jgi:hypothetical protein
MEPFRRIDGYPAGKDAAMLAIRRANAEAEHEERPRRPTADPKATPVKFRKIVDGDDREDLDDPSSLFWRGVWMTVF